MSPAWSRLAAALASLVSLALGAAGLAFFASPLAQKKEEEWADLGRADGFAPGKPVRVDFTSRQRDAWLVAERKGSAWIVKTDDGGFTVFDPRCTHLGCPYRWDVKDGRFVCPCHTAAFDAAGRVLGGPPPRALDRYSSKIVDGRLWALPRPEDGRDDAE